MTGGGGRDNNLGSDLEGGRISASEESALERGLALNQAGVWEIDARARTTFVSQSVAAMLGYAPGEILGHAPYAFMDALSAAALHWSLERRQDDQRHVREVTLCHKAGHAVPVLVAAAAIRSTEGEYLGSTAVVVDITERGRLDGEPTERASDAALSEQRRTGDGLIGTWSLHPATGDVDWSKEMFEIFGVDQSAFKPTFEAVVARIHPLDQSLIRRSTEAVLAGRKDFSTYFRVPRADGSTRLLHARAALTQGALGRLIAGTIHDVTDRLAEHGSVSRREREVLDLVAQGLTTEEVAQRLQISAVTVRSHVQNAIEKLGAHNRVHAVVLALRAGEIVL